MRQGQQNRRGRGRNNNNSSNHSSNHNQHRKGGQNPLTRSFESTGPDTKIRGTPAHIAEKYMALARDAHSSGDPVLAENYLQHAEHYNRIIMAYREQNQPAGDATNAGGQPQGGRFQSNDPRDPMGGGDDFGDEGDDFGGDQPSIGQQGEAQPQPQQQPRSFEERGPSQGGEGQRNHRPQHNNNRERFGGGERNFDRQDRGDRQRFDRNDRPERQDRNEPRSEPRGEPRSESRSETRNEPRNEPRFDRPERQPSSEASADPQRRRERERFTPAPTHEQPEFLRRPVRRPRREGDDAEPAAAAVAPVTDDTGRD